MAERHREDVIADVGRPRRDELTDFRAVLRVERTRRLLEVGEIAGHSPHERAGRLACEARALLVGLALSRVVDEPADGSRDPLGLLLEPLPVARKERDLARDHAELGPTRPRLRGGGFGGGRGMAHEHLVEGPAEVEVDLPPGVVLEEEDRGGRILVDDLLGDLQDGGEDAGYQPAVTDESRVRTGVFRLG